jgi:hypothetical protein
MQKSFIKTGVFVGVAIVCGINGAEAFNKVNAQVEVPVNHVYVPKGFDNNDHSEIVVQGMLPNLCHFAPAAKAKVMGKKILVSVTSNLNRQSMCAEMLVPFTLSVSVGVIKAGQYQIVINGGKVANNLSQMNITQSLTTQVDNNIYANVDTIERDAGKRMVKLSGYNPSDCYVFDRFEFVSNNVDTMSILPIMRKVMDQCPLKMTPFSLSVEIPATLTPDVILLHVRAMKGASVNGLFYQ